MIRRIAFLTLAVYASSAAADVAADAKTVVASQGGVEVTLGDIDAFVQRVSQSDRAGYMNSPKRIESTILNLLVQKQLAAEARKLKLDQDPLVAKQVELATDDVLARVRNVKLRADLKIPDFSAQAEEQYAANKADYVTKGVVNVEHVLISTSKHDKESALKIAEQVAREAKANPAEFPKLVEKYSDDDSKAKNHGRIDDAGSENFVPAFAEAARKLTKPNEISPVVLSPFGYHVLRLLEHKPDVQQSYDQVSKSIIAKLEKDWVEAKMRGHTDEIRNRAMDANPDVVASLRTRYLPPGTTLPPEPTDAGGAPGN